ncbi:MAG: glycosyltransferase family 1 protein [Prolixibacteraceae bacterium]|nr:glycosyltransferase family 1 protein [Prolixibacteraceae bacterium]
MYKFVNVNLGFDAKRAFLNSSGLGSYSRNTLNALQHFFPENNYFLFTPEINNEYFENISPFKVITPEYSIAKKLKSLWRSIFLVQQLKNQNIDLYHGLSNELPKGIGKTGINSVVTVHDLIFMRYPMFYKAIDRRIYYSKVKYACKVADKIVAVSNRTKDDIVNFLHTDPRKIEVIYQPVAPAFFKKQNTTNIRNKYNLPEKFILSVGTLEPRKNQLALLRAVKYAGISTRIVLTGNSTVYQAKLDRYISEKNMPDQVKILNNLPQNDLAGLYQSATLSVYISLYEGFGLPVIESMASGCPVISSNSSCLPETTGGAAILCDPDDEADLGEKIGILLENETMRNKFIRKGIERAAMFNPENYAQKLISLYKILTCKDNAE